MVKEKAELPVGLGVQGIAFTEIAAPDTAPVAKALEMAGFAPFRKHRKQPITLYKSGATYLMLREAAVATAPAMGLIVENVDTALRRAPALLDMATAEVHASGPTGPMGLHIPALRLANGGYFYLIETGEADTFFAFDFIAV